MAADPETTPPVMPGAAAPKVVQVVVEHRGTVIIEVVAVVAPARRVQVLEQITAEPVAMD